MLNNTNNDKKITVSSVRRGLLSSYVRVHETLGSLVEEGHFLSWFYTYG